MTNGRPLGVDKDPPRCREVLECDDSSPLSLTETWSWYKPLIDDSLLSPPFINHRNDR
ncbi:MAG: hypothetical protein M2R45_04846 [Verrucomicrobia subdivision 3 bacterium]|nr:hypothetical protein [Limisphaerales bacterium]MCS1416639.1 hypothetical protein [Limisphaerales bacterium]